MNTQTRPEDHIASLKTWLESQGGALHPSVQIAHDDDSGYHLRASSPVPANTSMVTVPFHSTFSILTSTVSWPDIIDMLLPVESPYMVMTRFAFVREYLLGKESQWYPYIAMLPQPSQVRAFPVQWEDGSDEMKWIRGTSLEESRSKKLETWKWEWEMGMKQLRGQEWAWDGGETRITWKLYKWAGTILAARTFPQTVLSRNNVPSQSQTPSFFLQKWKSGLAMEFPVLVPVLDLANHDPTTKNTWKVGEEAVSFTCPEPIEARLEIFYSYGPKPSVELLLNYGFTLPNNAFEMYILFFAPANAQSSFSNPYLSNPHQYTFFLSATNNPPFKITLSEDLIPTLTRHLARTREIPPPEGPPKLPASAISPDTYNLIPLTLPTAPTRLSTAAHAELLNLLLYRLKAIATHAFQVPNELRSTATVHAARYWNSEFHIVASCSERLVKYLSSLHTDGRLLDLDAILKMPMIQASYGAKILTQFRAAITGQFKTLDAKKLQEQGVKDLVWIIWLCTVWIVNDLDPGVASSSFGPVDLDIAADGMRPQDGNSKGDGEDEDKKTETYAKTMQSWLPFLNKTYCPPLSFDNSHHNNKTCNKQACFKTWKRESQDFQVDLPEIPNFLGGGGRGSWEYNRRMAGLESLLVMIRKAGERDPESVYRDKRWSKEFLWWGTEVWKAEGLGVPGIVFDGVSDKMEMVLFLEGGG